MRFSREQSSDVLITLEEKTKEAYLLSAKWKRTDREEAELSKSLHLLDGLTSTWKVAEHEVPPKPTSTDTRFIHFYALLHTREALEKIKKHPEYQTGTLEALHEEIARLRRGFEDLPETC